MKRLLIVLATLAAIGVAAIYGPAFYQSVLAARLFRAAKSEAVKGHPEQAIRFYTLSLQRRPNDLPVLKSFSDYLQKLHHPGALEVLQRIHSLEPDKPEATLEYAAVALTFGHISEALHLLATAGPAAGKMSRYYHLLSVARFMSGALPEADAACREALKLEPGNKVYLVNQATIELSSPTEQVRRDALDRLEKLAEDGPTALTALQSLLRQTARNPREEPHLEQWLTAFARYVQPRDYLYTLRLEALRRHRPDDFHRDLAFYLQSAAGDFEAAASAAEWMAGQQLWAEVQAFRQSLRPDWQDRMELVGPATRAAFELGQMEALGTLLEKPAWKSFRPDELAWRERLRRQLQKPGPGDPANETNWRKALAEAESSSAALTRLLELARQWAWRDEYQATLWTVVRRVPGGSADALSDLFNLDLRTGDSRDLLRVVKKQVEMAPGNPAHLNNLAFLSLLLDTDARRGEAIAEELCARFPGNPQFVSTLAFAQLKKGKSDEGIQLFRALDPSTLRGTSAGATYGLLLAAEGKKEANEFLQNAEVWMQLPEEQSLLAEARRQANATAPVAQ